jgi:hypothetical protein
MRKAKNTRAHMLAHTRCDLRLRLSARWRFGVAARCCAAATAGPDADATVPTLSPPGGTAAQARCAAHGPHGLTTCAVLRVFALLCQRQPRDGVWNFVQHSKSAAQAVTAAPQTIMDSRPRRRARAWRPSRAGHTIAVTVTNTTPLGASGTQSAASSTGTRTGAARATRSRSRCAPVRPQRRHAHQGNASLNGCSYRPHHHHTVLSCTRYLGGYSGTRQSGSTRVLTIQSVSGYAGTGLARLGSTQAVLG